MAQSLRHHNFATDITKSCSFQQHDLKEILYITKVSV